MLAIKRLGYGHAGGGKPESDGYPMNRLYPNYNTGSMPNKPEGGTSSDVREGTPEAGKKFHELDSGMGRT